MASERGFYIHHACLVAMLLEESDPGLPDDPRIPLVCERCARRRDAARDDLRHLYEDVLHLDQSYLGRVESG